MQGQRTFEIAGPYPGLEGEEESRGPAGRRKVYRGTIADILAYVTGCTPDYILERILPNPPLLLTGTQWLIASMEESNGQPIVLENAGTPLALDDMVGSCQISLRQGIFQIFKTHAKGKTPTFSSGENFFPFFSPDQLQALPPNFDQLLEGNRAILSHDKFLKFLGILVQSPSEKLRAFGEDIFRVPHGLLHFAIRLAVEQISRLKQAVPKGQFTVVDIYNQLHTH